MTMGRYLTFRSAFIQQNACKNSKYENQNSVYYFVIVSLVVTYVIINAIIMDKLYG